MACLARAASRCAGWSLTVALAAFAPAYAADGGVGVGDMTFQPTEERQAQDALPKGGNPLWNVLAATKVVYSE